MALNATSAGEPVGGKFYWLRLHRDFFKRHDVRIIESMENGQEYLLFLLKLMAESVDHEGRLRFSNAIPYNESMLATITATNVDTVRAALHVFEQLGLLERWDDETLYLKMVESMIGSRSESADRVAAWRAREKDKALQVTKSNVTSISISSSSSSSLKEQKSKRKLATHWKLGVPMNQTRYDNLCEEWTQETVDKYMQRVVDYATAHGKRYKCYASAAAGFMSRDVESGRLSKPTDKAFKRPEWFTDES